MNECLNLVNAITLFQVADNVLTVTSPSMNPSPSGQPLSSRIKSIKIMTEVSFKRHKIIFPNNKIINFYTKLLHSKYTPGLLFVVVGAVVSVAQNK